MRIPAFLPHLEGLRLDDLTIAEDSITVKRRVSARNNSGMANDVAMHIGLPSR